MDLVGVWVGVCGVLSSEYDVNGGLFVHDPLCLGNPAKRCDVLQMCTH